MFYRVQFYHIYVNSYRRTMSTDQVVMGDQGVGQTAFKRIEMFNDDKTEQVWELIRDEFARASVEPSSLSSICFLE